MEKNTRIALWIVGIVFGTLFLATIAANSSKNTIKTTNNYSNNSSSLHTTKPVAPKVEVKTAPAPITWHCTDTTSYNKNPYDDNLCISSTGERRYVSDSQARALDSSYNPGTYGHPYYNSK